MPRINLSSGLLVVAIHLLALSRASSGTYLGRDELMRRQIDPGALKAAYDYIVVGGGQSGLVIANRLSEDATKTVLVVEYGTFDDTPGQVEPSSATNYPARDLFNVTSVPQPGIGNKTGTVYAAAVVGGGSTINGMLFDRGSAEDYDNWEKLGNAGWGFSGLLPYFKKSTRFNTPIDPAVVADANITWDTSVYGTDGPVQVTYPPWVWPGTKIQFQAFNEVGVPTQVEAAAGKSYNAFWVPSNVDPNGRRSYARNQYFDPAKSRPNLSLLVNYRVNEVLFSSAKRAQSVRIQARGTANGAATITVNANTEIVLCAGWLHTPHILQRSGVGPKALLTAAGIPVISDLPGVGSNLQDHPAAFIQFAYRTDVFPNPSSAQTNATFAAWVQQQWTQRKGPLSVTTGNSLGTIPLTTMNPTGYQDIITKALAQTPATYLPKTYTAEQLSGFVEQRKILTASYGSSTNGIFEIPFSGGASTALCLDKPMSRGTVTLRTTDRYAEPSIDYNTNINPVDVDLTISAARFYRRWMAAPSMQQLGPTEQSPGTSLTTDAQLSTWVSSSMGSSTAHACCTSAMMPQNLGGVVSPELLVYGVTGLSVGDISVIPLIPATHTCATVYAIAEKAADLIKTRAASGGDPGTTSSTPTSTTTSTTSQPPTTTTTTTTAPVPTQTHWGQCGGQGWQGPRVCASPFTCQVLNPFYSQCL
ncbi:GMC oxidoreductase-domain-containing protein [Mycena albidolilacea]|uniref:GMC oxidoreductase-domain-containing protein n=1 Tax=Mycena albidolilacea TaxID=1033008 RepID=A0AAD6ZVG7_9AGAR|nr:GMC oxidoreductase-domain-containing protein [Mycena albidolilacea]